MIERSQAALKLGLLRGRQLPWWSSRLSREGSEFLCTEISNFNRRSKLIALG